MIVDSLVELKSGIIIIAKSQFCENPSTASKVDKETRKSKISVVQGKNNPTILHKLFVIDL